MAPTDPVYLPLGLLPPCFACGGTGCRGCTGLLVWAWFDDQRLYGVRGRFAHEDPHPLRRVPPLKHRDDGGWPISSNGAEADARDLAAALLLVSQAYVAQMDFFAHAMNAPHPTVPPAVYQHAWATRRHAARFDVARERGMREVQRRWPSQRYLRSMDRQARLRQEAESRKVARPAPVAQALPDLPPTVRALVRRAWLPVFREDGGCVGWTGGRPVLDADQPWPVGPYSGEPMTFAGAFEHPEHGWFQVFWDDWAGNAPDRVVVHKVGSTSRAPPPGVRECRRWTIDAWLPVDELPIARDDAWAACPDLAARMWDDWKSAHHACSKLGGWPTWIQNDVTSALPEDARRLQLQLCGDPDGYSWGTDGGFLFLFGAAIDRVSSWEDGS